jgi:Holliday junction resolvasome RuvABC endonuclease subunit
VTIILGVDPGLAATGLCLLEQTALGWSCLRARTVRTDAGLPAYERVRMVLVAVHDWVHRLSGAWPDNIMAVEDPFAVMAGQIRLGASRSANTLHTLTIVGGLVEMAWGHGTEFVPIAPRTAKAAVCTGKAQKGQVAACVRALVRDMPERFSEHVADAAAVAIAAGRKFQKEARRR